MTTVFDLVYRLLHALAQVPGLSRLITPRWQPVVVTEILTTGSDDEGTIYPAQPAITSRVQEFGQPFVSPEPEQFPAVGWRVVSHATVMSTRHFPYLVSGNQMMIGSRRNPGPWRVVRKGNQVVWQDGVRALVNRKRGSTLAVDSALLLGGHAHTNWYHWLVDALPQLHTAARLPDPYRGWPVLVPEEIFRYASMAEALQLFLDGREVIRIPEGSRVTGRICWIDSLEILDVPECLTTPRPMSQIHLLHREGMESYRQVFLDHFGDDPSPFGERVFLTRRGTRRGYNQDEIAEVAKELGFVAVAPEMLTLREQVALFRTATHLIGPSGAGFAGLLFSGPNTQVLCWQDSRLTAMTILPDLATLNHSDYWHVFYVPRSGGIFTGDYHLDPEMMRRTLHTFVSQTP
jgi:hypothetical protein